MTESQARTTPTKPEAAEVLLVRVVATTRLSPGFVRVTVIGHDELLGRTFAPMGYDQWVRLFLPRVRCEVPVVPYGENEGWYLRWQELDQEERATIRNYTVRAARRVADDWEIDIDFVVHASASGQVEGVAAGWAIAAQPGDVIGLLDQGTLFDPAGVDPEGTVVMIGDETGIPAAEGIAAALPEGQRALFLLEVSHAEDRRELVTRADLDVRWGIRTGVPSGTVLTELITGVELTERDYVYVVGEAGAVLRLRALAQEAGAGKERVDFCAYWRPERRAG
ncbi:MAG: siderophore-interacting protein [Propionibacteriales bacterium]|nr:siderophore-interacting protein [Propionibacteriales bacterium]